MPLPDEKPAADSGTREMWRKASQLSYVGIFFGVAVVIGWLAGHWLEQRWGGAPWVSLVGVLFGVAASFRELFRIVRSVEREARRTKPGSQG